MHVRTMFIHVCCMYYCTVNSVQCTRMRCRSSNREPARPTDHFSGGRGLLKRVVTKSRLFVLSDDIFFFFGSARWAKVMVMEPSVISALHRFPQWMQIALEKKCFLQKVINSRLNVNLVPYFIVRRETGSPWPSLTYTPTCWNEMYVRLFVPSLNHSLTVRLSVLPSVSLPSVRPYVHTSVRLFMRPSVRTYVCPLILNFRILCHIITSNTSVLHANMLTAPKKSELFCGWRPGWNVGRQNGNRSLQPRRFSNQPWQGR